MADEFNCMSQYSDADDSECSELRYSELEPLNLSEEQVAQIIAFLKTLDGPINAEPSWLAAPRKKKQNREQKLLPIWITFWIAAWFSSLSDTGYWHEQGALFPSSNSYGK